MYSRLNINKVDVPFFNELSISTNMSVADVREPDKRNSAFTKTISIPGTSEVNKIFEYCFDVNVALASFNPNLKTPATYYVNEIKVFGGDLQIISITESYVDGIRQLVYNCNIIGTNGNLFLAIIDLYLTDLAVPGKGYAIPGMPGNYGFTDLNHTLNYTNFSATPTPGTGYCYGYIDYGMGGLNGFNWNVEHMKAAIWEIEYVRRIFAAAGYTFSGSFFGSAYHNKIAIPDVNAGPYQYSPLQIQNNQFYAGKTTTTSLASVAAVINSGGHYFYTQNTGINPIIFNDDSTSPFNDPGNIYSTVSGQYTTTQNGQHTISATVNFSLILSAIAGAASFQAVFSQFFFEVYRNGGPSGNVQGPVYTNYNTVVSGGNATISTSQVITFSTANDPVGTIYQVVFAGTLPLQVDTIDGFWLDGGGVPINTGAASNLTFRIDAASTFFSNLASTNQSFGNTIDMNTTIPTLVKQIDFLTSIFKAHNLYIEQDKDNPRNYLIEPRDSFIDYTQTADSDWTYKQDLSQPIEILPMGDLDARSYTYAYKTDSDYFNKRYQDKWKETYGQNLVNVETDFQRTDKKIELVFSPTPGAAFQTDIVAPRFLSIEGAYPGTGGGGTVSPLKVNIRRLYWGGMISCNLHNLQTSSISIPSFSQYPFLGMVDQPFTPTLDLGFNAPREVYYSGPAQTWTTNNLYNKYWNKLITEISDKNSKIVKTYVLLTERDINKFTFRQVIWIRPAYYLVNSIKNYDPQKRQSVLVELLKLKTGQNFTAASYNPGDPIGQQNFTRQTTPEFNDQGNYGQSGSMVVGRNLINYGNFGILTGTNSQVQRGVTNFDAIGAKDINFNSGYNNKTSIRNDALLVSASGVELMKIVRGTHTANFNVTNPKEFVDASGGNIDAILPDLTHISNDFEIIRIDNSGNTVTVKGVLGTELLETNGASATSYALPTRTTKKFSTNNTKWFY